ncbi:MAG: preprotein translocase subunit SecG [candidate division KSB1 bacterium]|nr:preprotein translocase subunit SecG [candidate division KSB1 bacterium]MDZ7304412.1 preprotein translocase subunit SecG [candidate division KSB1 bacterium]MDZ7313362.1 preprotein translocase subunit SecG [candidate division KSB1 bacterium]
MYSFVVTIFVVICILQVITILLQSSKGGGLAGAFGGGGMGAMFGGRGAATFLSKVTAVLATLFMVIALILGLMSSRGGQSQGLVERERQTRASSPAAILPSVPGTEAVQPQQPATPEK